MKKVRAYFSTGLLSSIILIFLVMTFNMTSSLFGDDGYRNIEGVYELVSQEINITAPQKESSIFTQPRWKGLWQFHDGYFSSVLMKDERDKFFECKDRDLGYESFAGAYTVEGDKILLKQTFSLHPYYKGRPIIMKYSVKNGILTLTQVLHSTIEDKSEGTVKIILKKLPKR